MKRYNFIRTLFTSGILFMLPIFFSCSSYAEHTVSIAVSGLETINVVASDDNVSIAETELNITTTCKSGYNLFLSSTVDDNNLYLDGDSDHKNSNEFFAPSDGVTSLALASNVWGVYYSDGNDNPSADSVFLAVPSIGEFSVIKNSSEAASTGPINDTISLYYGIKASENLTPGFYSMKKDEDEEPGKVVYYATLSEDCFRYTVKYNPTGTNLGIPITGTGSVSNQYITEGLSDNLTTDVYGNPIIDGVTYYFMGWNTLQDGTGIQYEGGQSVIDLAPVGDVITLYAQWNDCLEETICYYSNHDEASGSMGYQPAESNSDAILLAPNYSLSRYGFAGWSKDKNAASKYVGGEATTIYGPNQTINVGDLSDMGLRLYAVWLEPVGTLQGWSGCGDLEIGEVTALRDARDENAYAVAKLADERCWMIENLRLESENSLGENALLSQGYNTGFTGLANAENENFTNSTIANSLYSTNGSTENTIVGDYVDSRFPRYNNSNTISNDDRPLDANKKIFGYGNYYTWAAAVANTASYYSMNTIVDHTSICPHNWKIPSGGNKDLELINDYWGLVVDGVNSGIKPSNYYSFTRPYYYGDSEATSVSEKLRQYPNNFVLSGSYSNNASVNKGSVAGYWTSVTSVSNGSYLLNIERNRVDPGTAFSSKYSGFSVRCLYNN